MPTIVQFAQSAYLHGYRSSIAHVCINVCELSPWHAVQATGQCCLSTSTVDGMFEVVELACAGIKSFWAK